MGVTGYEARAYADLTALRRAAERIADALERPDCTYGPDPRGGTEVAPAERFRVVELGAEYLVMDLAGQPAVLGREDTREAAEFKVERLVKLWAEDA